MTQTEQIDFSELRTRAGRFLVSRAMIEARPDMVQFMLGQVLVIYAQGTPDGEAIEYTAFSERFDPCAPGFLPPIYNATVTTSDDGQVHELDMRHAR